MYSHKDHTIASSSSCEYFFPVLYSFLIFFLPSEVPIVYRQPTFNDVPFSSLFFLPHFFLITGTSFLCSLFIRFMFVLSPLFISILLLYGTVFLLLFPLLTCPRPHLYTHFYTLYCGTLQFYTTFNLNSNRILWMAQKTTILRIINALILSSTLGGRGRGRLDS